MDPRPAPGGARLTAPPAEHPLIEAILAPHAAAIGADWRGYRHHVYRVAALASVFGPVTPEITDKLAIAAAFHDLGIWTAGTFDYLDPSMALAAEWLAATGRAAWTDELLAMIQEHHRIRPIRTGDPTGLVERFRKADWVDVTMGALTFGLRRGYWRELTAAWPTAGFHRGLVRLTLARMREHPLSPLPMLRF